MWQDALEILIWLIIILIIIGSVSFFAVIINEILDITGKISFWLYKRKIRKRINQ